MNLELVNYVKQQLRINVSKNKIVDVLLGQGWQQADIDEAFAAAEGRNIQAPEIDYRDFGGGADFGESEEGADRFGGRPLVFAAVGGIMLLVLAGIIALVYTSGKKTPDDAQNSGPDGGAPQISQVNNSQPADKTETKVAETNAAIARLAATITPPAGWVPDGRMSGIRSVAIFNKPVIEKDTSGKDIFNENINVTEGSLKSADTASEADYIAKSKKALQNLIADYKFTAHKTVKLGDGTAATLLGSSYTLSGIPVRNIQLFAIKGDKVYIITGITLAANWEQEKDMLGEAVMSFEYPTD